KICLEEDAIEFSKEKFSSINAKLTEIRDDLKWFLDLFEPKDELLNASLPQLIDRMEACVNNLHNLEEFVDYKNCKNKCNTLGLSNYIYKVELQKITPNQIVQIFEKQFLRKWLDEVL